MSADGVEGDDDDSGASVRALRRVDFHRLVEVDAPAVDAGRDELSSTAESIVCIVNTVMHRNL